MIITHMAMNDEQENSEWSPEQSVRNLVSTNRGVKTLRIEKRTWFMVEISFSFMFDGQFQFDFGESDLKKRK